MPDLLHALVQREQPAGGEQHQRDEEAVDVAVAAVAERVLAASAARRAERPPRSSSPWLPESTTECTPSASIDDEPVIANATNLITAMPRLAPSAATIALRAAAVALIVSASRSAGPREPGSRPSPRAR